MTMADSDDGKVPRDQALLISDLYKEMAADERSVARKSGEWVGAALLALHGGATVALMGIYNKSGIDIIALSFFGFGLFITVVSGILLNHISYNNWQVNYQIQNDFLFSRRSSLIINGNIGKWKKFRSEVPFYMRIISSCVFVAGAAIGAYNLRETDKKTEATCRLVEEDMMRRVSLKADSPAVFQALGCRPQGGWLAYAKPAKIDHAASRSIDNRDRR